MSKINIAVCTLNQLALDFSGNLERILKSLDECKDRNVSIRIGPELEICGYCCEDAFFEEDTVFHSWQVLAKILEQKQYKNILIDLGMPINKDSSLYNCRVLILNSKIIAIRPKTILANNGNYRENRWFTNWDDSVNCCWFKLPLIIRELTKQDYVPFGSNLVIDLQLNNDINNSQFGNTSSIRLGFEICEELWNPVPEHLNLFNKRGCNLICNSSASYWEIRKLNKTLDLIRMATSKCGGVYAYSNLIGCDGQRLCFYGRSVIISNGDILAKTTNIDTLLKEVDIAVAEVDINSVLVYRRPNNIKIKTHLGTGCCLEYDLLNGFTIDQSSLNAKLDNLTIYIKNFDLFRPSTNLISSNKIDELNLKPEQEIYYFTSLWLWDYLRKCKFSKGFIVPLSGGLDSCSVALIVYSMCNLIARHIKFTEIRTELKRILQLNDNELDQLINTHKENLDKELCRRMLRCCYLKTKYSGQSSQKRANDLAELICAEFHVLDFTTVYENISDLGNSLQIDNKNIQNLTITNQQQSTNEEDKIHKKIEDQRKLNEKKVTIIQQNLQARIRMLLTYFLSNGSRLVLATGNVDEALVGYLTKYDCSAADLNPIGSLSKQDLRSFIDYIRLTYFSTNKPEIISSILDAIPSAELSGEEQKDEDEIGLTYEELSWLGSIRKGDIGCYGPYGMFCKLWSERSNSMFKVNDKLINLTNCDKPEQLAEKVKRFFILYSRNRHKQTVLTPALHAVTYSPDDNRFDHRQFLYDTNWKWQFKCIDEHVWHKLCFKCQDCGMTLNMKTYKGFNKFPYCNAHVPHVKPITTVNSLESRRLAELTKLQSQVKYHENFEKSKGKVTQIADDVEMQRLKQNSKNQSQVKYHGELERKQQMDYQRKNQLSEHQMNEQNKLANNNNLINNQLNGNYQKNGQYALIDNQIHNQNNLINNQLNNKHFNGQSVYNQTKEQQHAQILHQQKMPEQKTIYQLHQQQQDYINPQKVAQYVTSSQQMLHQQQRIINQPLKQQPFNQTQLNSNILNQQQIQYQNQFNGNNHFVNQQPYIQPKEWSPADQQQQNRVYRAIYDYTAADVDEVSFKDGDLITNCIFIDEGWLTGVIQRTGQYGMIPSNYIMPVN